MSETPAPNNRLFLIIAIVLMVLGTVVAYVYISSQATVPTNVAIYVAKRDLPAGTSLSIDQHLREEFVPSTLVDLTRSAINKSTIDAYRNQRINRPILAGTPLFKSDLTPATDFELGTGKVAMAIPAQGAAALGGNLVPGDFVLVYTTKAASRARPVMAGGGGGSSDMSVMPGEVTSWNAESILTTPVRVLAVGTSLTRQRQQITTAEQDSMAGSTDTSRTVTLELTSEEVKTLLEKTGAGQLPVTLVLTPVRRVPVTVAVPSTQP